MRLLHQNSSRSIRIVITVIVLLIVLIIGYVLYSRQQKVAVAPPVQQPQNGSQTTKSYIVGLMNRDGPPTADLVTYNGKPLVTGYVIQAYWNELQPNGPTDFDTSSIDQQLVFATQHNMPVRLRVYAGYHTPAWVMKQTGSVTWQGTTNDAGPNSYQIPKFWTTGYQMLWQNFDRKLASRYDNNSVIHEVVPGMCTTNFDEPLLRQFAVQQNITTAVANGYTDALNNSCLQTTIDMFKADWKQTNMDMTLNPYDSISAATDKLIEPTYLAKYCLSQLGNRCVLGNNSMKGGTQGSAYADLYTMMKSLRAPIYIQTATNAKISDWQQALTNAVDIGAQSIELPTGYTSYDRTNLQQFNSKLSTNATN